MLRVVLPGIPAAIPAANVVMIHAVAALNVGVSVEIIVVVDGDVVIATPPAAPSPPSGPHRAHRHADAERDGHARGVISRRRVVNGGIRVSRGSINDDRVVTRHINYVGLGLLDNDDLLAFHHLGLDCLLLAGFEIAFVLGLRAHALHRIHYLSLLSEKGVSQIGGPLDVICQAFHDVRKTRHGLHAGIPGLLLHRISQRFILEVRIFLQPLLKLNQFKRIG